MAAAGLISTAAARRYDAVPVAYRGERTLLVAMADPANVVAMDDIAIMTGMEIRPAVASREDLQALVGRLGRMEDVVPDLVDGPEHEFSQAEVVDLRESVDDAPIIKLANQIIAQAVEQGASDIHLEPEMDCDARPPAHRRRAERGAGRAARDGRRRREPHQGHGRAGHRRAARPAGRPRRAEHRRPPRRPPRGHPPERARRVGRHAHPRQGVGGHGPRPPWDGGGRPPPLRACDPRALRRGPRHRPDRLGQVDVALRGARRAQHAREEHRHDRGPGRVPARGRHPGAGQPARRPRLRHRPASHDARRSRHHHGRRDPRPRDGADRRRGGAHRPPRPLDAAHERRGDRDHPPRGDGRGAVPRRQLDRLRRRPAPRPHAVPALQAARDHPGRDAARQRLPVVARRRGLRARRAAPAATAPATRAASASTRSW